MFSEVSVILRREMALAPILAFSLRLYEGGVLTKLDKPAPGSSVAAPPNKHTPLSARGTTVAPDGL